MFGKLKEMLEYGTDYVMERLWRYQNTVLISLFLVILIMLACSGCGSMNFYYEHDATGLDLTVPVCGQRVGLTVGAVKSTSTSVRGGTSFNSQSTSGVGITGAATTTRVTTFRSNAQLNEGNIVKIMESPNMAEKAKIVLAKQLGDGVVAPDFEPVAMRTRDGVIYSNGYKGSAIPNDFSPTGIDKIVEDATGVINNIADDATATTNAVIGGATESIQALSHSLTTTRIWAGISMFITFLISWLLIKKKPAKVVQPDDKPPTIPKPPVIHEMEDDEAVRHDDEEAGVIDVPEVEHPVQTPIEPPVKRKWWQRLAAALVTIIAGWFSIDKADRDEIVAGLKKKK